jgi:hypothetical protein
MKNIKIKYPILSLLFVELGLTDLFGGIRLIALDR